MRGRYISPLLAWSVCLIFSELSLAWPVTVHSRAGTEHSQPSAAVPALRLRVRERDNTGPTLSLSLSLSGELGGPIMIIMMMLVSSHLYWLPPAAAQTVGPPACLSGSGLARPGGACRGWGNVRLIVRWWLQPGQARWQLVPRHTPVTRREEMTLSSRGQWSPWEQEADIFSHWVWCKAVTGDKTADSRLSHQCEDISNKTSLTSVSTTSP